MVNQLAAAHERDLIQPGCKIHLTVNYPERKDNDDIKDDYIPGVKLQLIQEGKKKDLDIGDVYQPDIPIFF